MRRYLKRHFRVAGIMSGLKLECQAEMEFKIDTVV